MEFFDVNGNQNTAAIASCLRRLCILASPPNLVQFHNSDVCTVIALQMKLHMGQIVAIAEAYAEMARKSKKAHVIQPPVDHGLALYGSALIHRLLVMDRSDKIKKRLLERSVDAPSILDKIRKIYPYYSGSFRYATLALKHLVPPMPPTFDVIK